MILSQAVKEALAAGDLPGTAAVFGVPAALGDLYRAWARFESREPAEPSTYQAFAESFGNGAALLVLARTLTLSAQSLSVYRRELAGRRDTHRLLIELLEAASRDDGSPPWLAAVLALARQVDEQWDEPVPDERWSYELPGEARSSLETWCAEALAAPVAASDVYDDVVPTDAPLIEHLRHGLPAVIVASLDVEVAVGEAFASWRERLELPSGDVSTYRQLAASAGEPAVLLLLLPALVRDWLKRGRGHFAWLESCVPLSDTAKQLELVVDILARSSLRSADEGRALFDHAGEVSRLLGELDVARIDALDRERSEMTNDDWSRGEAEWTARWHEALRKPSWDALDDRLRTRQAKSWLPRIEAWARATLELPERQALPSAEIFERNRRVSRLFIDRHSAPVSLPVDLLAKLAGSGDPDR